MKISKENFSYDFLETIKEEITKIKPYLGEILESSFFSDSFVSLVPAKKQGFYFLLSNQPVSSRIDPVTEAERIFLNSFEKIKKSKIIFLFGLGNFYLFNLIYENIKNKIFIVIEEEDGFVQYYWKHFEVFHKFLLTPNCHVFTEKNISLLLHYINSLNLDSLKSYAIIQCHPLYFKKNHYYLEIEKKIHLLFKSNFSSLLTQFEFETLWFRNIFCNLHFLKKDHPYLFLNFYKNKFDSVPFVIVGAGPSLRFSKKILEEVSNKAFILATDASVKPLLRMGIIPDAIHILDAQIHSYFHLRGVDLRNQIIFADIVVHPFLIRNLKPLGWVFSTTTKYKILSDGRIQKENLYGIQILEKIFGCIGSLQSGGSVSTSAFEIARFLGAKTILLIGMDLSWTNRQLHCVHTHHYEKWFSESDRTKTIEMFNEGLFQKRIKEKVQGIKRPFTYGDAVLNLYKFWFEDTAQELKDQVFVYNITYDGACIRNIEHRDNVDFLNEINKKNLLDLFKESFANYVWEINTLEMTNEIVKEIIKLIYKYDLKNDIKSYESFYNEFLELQSIFPDLEVFSRKNEVYIKRNLEKISQEKITCLRYNNIFQDLKKFIKFYISFNTSFIHSDTF
ncbi:MAG: motility associated factor glycosyltransferase family protein [Leptonema sp. (in: bacteria)]